MSGRRSVKLENNSKQIDLNEMCRLCLSKLQEKTVNIFDSSNEKSLLIKIIDCTGVVVSIVLLLDQAETIQHIKQQTNNVL